MSQCHIPISHIPQCCWPSPTRSVWPSPICMPEQILVLFAISQNHGDLTEISPTCPTCKQLFLGNNFSNIEHDIAGIKYQRGFSGLPRSGSTKLKDHFQGWFWARPPNRRSCHERYRRQSGVGTVAALLPLLIPPGTGLLGWNGGQQQTVGPSMSRLMFPVFFFSLI